MICFCQFVVFKFFSSLICECKWCLNVLGTNLMIKFLYWKINLTIITLINLVLYIILGWVLRRFNLNISLIDNCDGIEKYSWRSHQRVWLRSSKFSSCCRFALNFIHSYKSFWFELHWFKKNYLFVQYSSIVHDISTVAPPATFMCIWKKILVFYLAICVIGKHYLTP